MVGLAQRNSRAESFVVVLADNGSGFDYELSLYTRYAGIVRIREFGSEGDYSFGNRCFFGELLIYTRRLE